ncbi:hypothetical protein FQR65_LT13060 [Abscondita terminalis]|nr:hypothetical protein FQR65_LT13060 [Abscondita terminalis]
MSRQLGLVKVLHGEAARSFTTDVESGQEDDSDAQSEDQDEEDKESVAEDEKARAGGRPDGYFNDPDRTEETKKSKWQPGRPADGPTDKRTSRRAYGRTGGQANGRTDSRRRDT